MYTKLTRRHPSQVTGNLNSEGHITGTGPGPAGARVVTVTVTIIESESVTARRQC